MTGKYHASFVDRVKAGQGQDDIAKCWRLESVAHEVIGKTDDGMFCLIRHGIFTTPLGMEKKVTFSITASSQAKAEKLLEDRIQDVVANGTHQASIHVSEDDPPSLARATRGPILGPYVTE